jgi:SagB-type dehydrogenase family enzyme
MKIDFSKLFHLSSKGHDSPVLNAASTGSQWPPEWRTIYYKSYPQLEKITLPETSYTADLFETIRKRRSTREFDTLPIDIKKLSTLLRYSCGIAGSKQNETLQIDGSPVHNMRAQPSGGGRFPVETYVLVFVGTPEVPAGTYHYNVKMHSLDVLKERSFSATDISNLITYDFVKKASCVIILTAVFKRSQMKYGERGYRYIMLEAGHIGQNLYLTSEALDLGCCAMGGTQDTEIEKLLDIDGVGESVLYGIVIG